MLLLPLLVLAVMVVRIESDTLPAPQRMFGAYTPEARYTSSQRLTPTRPAQTGPTPLHEYGAMSKSGVILLQEWW